MSADEPSTLEIDQAAFVERLDALVSEVGGTTAIVVELPDGTLLYDHNGAEQIESASLYKLGVMVEVYRQRDMGLLSFDDGVYMYPGFFSEGEDAIGFDAIDTTIDVLTLLDLMITASSNVAATALLDLVGTDNINATLRSLGITATEIRWSPDHDLEEDCCAEPTPGDEVAEPEPTPDDGAEPQPTPADGAEPEPTPSEPSEPEPTQDIVVEPTPSDVPVEDPSQPEGRTRVTLTSAPVTDRRVSRTLHADTRADAALNVTTAEDLAGLYVLLLRGEVISPQTSQEMLDLLARQEINDRLPALLPEGTVVAHKTGNLDGLVHDAGVIYAPAGPIVVVVLTEDIDEGTADDLIAQVGLTAFEVLSNED